MDWSYFDKFEPITARYLPEMGEGNNKATQIVTAVTKLVYKWYNDGDVFDNTGAMTGWANDLSSYANWLHENTKAGYILDSIWDCYNDRDYERLLADLADTLLDGEDLEHLEKEPKTGSIYDCEGPFQFVEYNEDEEDEEDW